MKKPLPTVAVITKTVTIPSTGQSVVFRPYTAKEEKILLMAQAGDEASKRDLQERALYTIMRNCSMGQFDPAAHPWFDLEYVILQLRCLSLGTSDVTILLGCQKRLDTGAMCEGKMSVTIDLESITVSNLTANKNTISLRHDIGVTLRYPRLDDLQRVFPPQALHEGAPLQLTEHVYEFVRDSIVTVFDANDVYDASEYTREELDEFLGAFRVNELEPIFTFYRDLPTVEHTVQFTCPQCGNSGPYTFRGVQDFLLWSRHMIPSKITT